MLLAFRLTKSDRPNGLSSVAVPRASHWPVLLAVIIRAGGNQPGLGMLIAQTNDRTANLAAGQYIQLGGIRLQTVGLIQSLVELG